MEVQRVSMVLPGLGMGIITASHQEGGKQPYSQMLLYTPEEQMIKSW